LECGGVDHATQPRQTEDRKAPLGEIRSMFRILNPIPNARANYNAEPTDNLPVVRLDHEKRRSLDVLRKGLIRTGRRAPGSGRAVSKP